VSRPAAEQHLQRLLVMVPWIVAQDGPTVDEVCTRFEIRERDLVADLELLFMCGLYPFTPDTLIEADVVDGRVWIRYADSFERPPTFTAEEAVSLVAAASAVLDLPELVDDPALASALHKLSVALGIDEDELVDVELASASDATVNIVRSATERHRRIEVDYYSYGRDQWSRRVLEPLHVFNQQSQWYLQAVSVEVGERRTFRIDRMRNVTALDETFEVPTELDAPTNYTARPEDPTITLDLDESSRWVAEQYPVEDLQARARGVTRVTLKVSEPRWAERLLLELGPRAKVVQGQIDPSNSARRILRRYDNHA
jgi:proteasome accessory factor C